MKIGLIGNPNVGKSTIFNALTGLRQHTGNWPGKTVEQATGHLNYKNKKIIIEDLPGTYSLMAHSKEEEVTRDFVYNKQYDGLVIVCDAVCLERNLNLVLQILEITSKVVVCVNLIDEATKKGIKIDTKTLSKILKVPIVETSARGKKGLDSLLEEIINIKENKKYKITYNEYLTKALEIGNQKLDKNALKFLYNKGIKKEDIQTLISEDISIECQKIASRIITFTKENYNKNQYLIDKIVTNRITGNIIMLLMLFVIFWITIKGANYISDFLYKFLFTGEEYIFKFLKLIHIPNFIINPLIFGIIRTLFWVVAVMLPPMAIFFPLFTLLEDLGYLPRVAFNLDHIFQKCNSCGKQALTMSMGFGCNAVGVIGARIIDSPRERLIAILTNSFVPCNGRFPILISIIAMFLVYKNNSFISALILTLFILLSILMTFIASLILSKTILKGVPSAFTLELPCYRRPQITKVIIRSVLDRTLFVLRRAICISAPAGLIIWLLANITINNLSILNYIINFLNPLAGLFGLDGVILMAFILALPANEIIIPMIVMGYMSLGYMIDLNSIAALKTLFINHGWTIKTAVCVIVLTLMHWPCLTTILTIKKETNLKWSLISVLIPALFGFTICFIINLMFYVT